MYKSTKHYKELFPNIMIRNKQNLTLSSNSLTQINIKKLGRQSQHLKQVKNKAQSKYVLRIIFLI